MRAQGLRYALARNETAYSNRDTEFRKGVELHLIYRA